MEKETLMLTEKQFFMYLVLDLIKSFLLFAGTFYAVFFMGASGWFFAVPILMSSSPKFTRKEKSDADTTDPR